MHFIYNLGIRFYGFALRIASLSNPKAKKWIQGRKRIYATFPNVSDKQVVWFHCASLGEFDQGLTLMHAIKKENPTVYLIVTFFSPSGFENYHKRNHPADFVCYLPLDTPSNAKKFVNHFKPKLVFFVKYEFWANYIFAAKREGAKVYLVSGIFRGKQIFFKWYGAFFRTVLKQFDQFFIQNSKSKKLLDSININNAQITSDNRFDAVLERQKIAVKNTKIEHFLGNSKAFMIGSSWPVDEEVYLPFINQKAFTSKIIIAPHNIKEEEIKRLISRIEKTTVIYSEMTEDQDLSWSEVLILDTIGQLTDAYQYADIAYIGGGFSGNLHNILEPGVYNIPVIFGPKHQKFPEAQMFIEAGIAKSVSTTEEFNEAFRFLAFRKEEIKLKSKNLMNANSGATDSIMSYLKQEGNL